MNNLDQSTGSPQLAGKASRRQALAVDLYFGHHRPAEDRQHQSSPHPELGLLVLRADGCFARGSDVRLPAGLSQCRRYRRAMHHAKRGWVGRARGRVFR
jgi:hypothetical protein